MDQIASVSQTAVVDIGHVPTDLAHPRGVRLRRDPGDVDASRREFEEEQLGESCQAASGPDVTVKKSAAASTSQCVRRNSAHVVFLRRSGAESSPCSRRTLAMVPRERVPQGALEILN